ncbi:hypothetical protein ACFWDI_40585, partial [Streptomyces sp. NPDC060064]
MLEETGTVQRRLRALPSRVGIYFQGVSKLVAGLAGLQVSTPTNCASARRAWRSRPARTRPAGPVRSSGS